VSVHPFFPILHVRNCSVHYDHQVLPPEFHFTDIGPLWPLLYVQILSNFIDYLQNYSLYKNNAPYKIHISLKSSYSSPVFVDHDFCLTCSNSKFNFEILNRVNDGEISWTGLTPSQTYTNSTNTERTQTYIHTPNGNQTHNLIVRLAIVIGLIEI
jgi:hypothetical protein